MLLDNWFVQAEDKKSLHLLGKDDKSINVMCTFSWYVDFEGYRNQFKFDLFFIEVIGNGTATATTS